MSQTKIMSAEQSLISVIIPVYNSKDSIIRCLNSICTNTYHNLEIICVDDGSSDGTESLLDNYSDPRVRVIHQHNAGVSRARNRGLETATGEYIAFVDSDDCIHNRYFERLLHVIQKADIAQCSYVNFNCELSIPACTDDEPQYYSFREAFDRFEVRSFVWGKMYRTNILNKKRFLENISFSEDKIFNAGILCDNGTIGIITDPLYYYYVCPNSLAISNKGNLLPVGTAFLQLAKEKKNTLLLEQAYKAYLGHRYLHMFDDNTKEISLTCNKKLKDCANLASEIGMPFKQAFAYNIMRICPVIYRSYRIATDRTMIQWERNMRRKRAQN